MYCNVLLFCRLYFDNLFTSMALMRWLSEHELGGTGTVRANQVISMPHPEPKAMEKEERGTTKTYYTEDCMVIAWRDNKSVYVALNVHPVGDGTNTAMRYSKAAHGKITVKQPAVIKAYNKLMGGVDLVDQMIACYRPMIRKRKWWWPIYTWVLSLMLVNSWRLWNIVKPDASLGLLPYVPQVVNEMLTRHGERWLRTG